MANSRANREWDIIITKAADESRASSSTLANDAVLLSTLSVGMYHFELHIIIDSAATPDFKYTVAFGGTSDANFGFNNDYSSSSGIVWGTSKSVTSSAWPISLNVYGFALVSAGGVLSLQWAQNTSDAANTILKKGSQLFIKKVAPT